MNVKGEVEGENISCPLSMSITYDFKVIISLTIDCELSSLIFGESHDTSVVSHSSKKIQHIPWEIGQVIVMMVGLTYQ